MLAIPGNHPLEYLKFCLETWQRWCDWHAVELVLVKEPLADSKWMPPTWQKMYAVKALDDRGVKFDRAAIIDIDTMVRWDCPNIFDEADGRFAAVAEDTELPFVLGTIRDFQPMFRGVVVPWYQYFNSGMLVFTDAHRGVFDSMLRYFERHQPRLAKMKGMGTASGADRGGWRDLPLLWNEQTPLNYMVRKLGVDLKLLPKPFNLTHLLTRGILASGEFIDAGYIWHFTGFDKHSRYEVMRATWASIRSHYRSKPKLWQRGDTRSS